MGKQLIYSLLVSISFLLASCGGSSGDKPEPTPPPTITSFTASENNILAGDAVTLTAIFSNGQGTIDTGVGSIASGETKVVLPNNTTSYTLTVENTGGEKVSATVTVETVPLIITSITNPTDETVHDNVFIRASIVSQLDLVEVVAEVAGYQTSLRHYSDNYYVGELSLTGLVDGEYTLTVTGKDELGRTNNKQKQITVDNLPFIEVHEPTEYSFANPKLPLDISCFDATGACLITVKIKETILSSAVNNINEIIDLSDFIGEEVTLVIEGESNTNQITTKQVNVYVNDEDVNMIHVKTLSDEIIDFDGERALTYGDVPLLGKQVKIANIINNTVEILDTPTEHPVNYDTSFLTATGAVFQIKWGETFDWNNNEQFSLGKTDPVRSAGDYILFENSTGLIQRKLSTQADLVLDVALQNSVVSANGTVVGENNWSLLQYKDQELTRINMQPESSTGTSEQPLIDGSLILYHETGDFGPRRIILHDGNDMIFAINPTYHLGITNRFYLTRGKDYQINKGWIAYLDGVDSEANQLWTRDKQGNLLKRTSFPSGSSNSPYQMFIDNLASSGELMLVHDGKRYLSKLNGDLLLVGDAERGKSYYINDMWFIVIENSIFKLDMSN